MQVGRVVDGVELRFERSLERFRGDVEHVLGKMALAALARAAPWNWREVAALIPLWSSDTTRSTPFTPRRLRSLKRFVQVVSFSVSATLTARISR